MRTVVRLAITLFAICSLAAASLALVARVTRDPIEQQALRETEEALRAVSPAATGFAQAAEGQWDALGSQGSVGRAQAVTAKGYGGPIKLVVGMDEEGRITGVRVVSQTETPGLGTKVAEDNFLGQFVGIPPRELRLTKDDPTAGTIDAVTAATISSRAVVDALRQVGGR